VRQPVESRELVVASRDLCLDPGGHLLDLLRLGHGIALLQPENVLQQARRLLDDRENVLDLMGRPGDQAADQIDFSRLH
jgi:hypothetical protein